MPETVRPSSDCTEAGLIQAAWSRNSLIPCPAPTSRQETLDETVSLQQSRLDQTVARHVVIQALTRPLLICEPDGRIARASSNGYALLAQASGCRINRETVPGRLERTGAELIRRLLAAPVLPAGSSDARGPSRSAALLNAWGMFRLRVFFESSGPMAVLIERVDDLLVRLCEAMWRLDLSP